MSFLSSAILFCNDWTVVIRSLVNIYSKACPVFFYSWYSCKAKVTFESLIWKHYINHCTKKKFSLRISSVKWDQIRSFLQNRSHFLEISLMENFIFCAVNILIRARPFCSAFSAMLMQRILYVERQTKKFLQTAVNFLQFSCIWQFSCMTKIWKILIKRI